MKRIIIICEGITEQEFCKKSLSAYFNAKQIDIQYPLIKKSNGGIVKWNGLKKQIENHLKQDRTAYVTTLIDYYGIYQRYNFPRWEESLAIVDKDERMNFLEQEMYNDIDTQLNNRFIPYIQLHEFEGLLFNNISIFRQQFTEAELIGLKELEETISDFPNPEMINDNPNTAPSKRLGRIIKGYNKIVYGNILAETIGLQNIRNKSPRFNAWINKIENVK
ncbi:MAG: DUF4276 family protein [Bacteroidales bacterium]|nr:DUF4276 family protein [Bacteroidales bacterium]